VFQKSGDGVFVPFCWLEKTTNHVFSRLQLSFCFSKKLYVSTESPSHSLSMVFPAKNEKSLRDLQTRSKK
jgi:hypothetical protein